MTLFDALIGWLKPAPPPSPQVLQALKRVAELVDPMMSSATGFEKKLAVPVQRTLDYCEKIVLDLSGPIDIDRQSFASEPLIHALFATADDIARVLGGDRAVRDYLESTQSRDSDCFYAMLAARRQSKKTLGIALDGDMVRGDVPVEYLYFSDHTLTAPGPTLEATREGLRQAAFDSLLKNFRTHLQALRDERETLRDDRDITRDRINRLRGNSANPEIDAQTRRLNELDERLRQIAELLQPEHLVDALVDFLATPATALRLEIFSVKIDRSGVVTHGDAADAESLDFRQIIGRDRRRHVAFLIKARREDAVLAVEEVKELRRNYMII